MSAYADKDILEDKGRIAEKEFVERNIFEKLNFISPLFAFLWERAFNILNPGRPVEKRSFSELKVRKNRLKHKSKGENVMYEVVSQRVKTYEAYSHSVAWLDLEQCPSEELAVKKLHFCLDYNDGAEARMVQWIKKSRADFSLWKKPLAGITVFARFDELAPGESMRLTRLFGKAGGTLNDYPATASDFIEAVKVFNEEITGARSRAKSYGEKRKKFARESSARI